MPRWLVASTLLLATLRRLHFEHCEHREQHGDRADQMIDVATADAEEIVNRRMFFPAPCRKDANLFVLANEQTSFSEKLWSDPMNTAVDPIPVNLAAPVLGGVTPYLQVDGASAASALYQRAFGGVEVARHPVDDKGRTMHVHLHINGSSIMLSDPYPEHGYGIQKPQAFNLTLQVDDIDFWWSRAIEAGITAVMPVQRMFWGDRYGTLRDPFGVMWAMNEPARR